MDKSVRQMLIVVGLAVSSLNILIMLCGESIGISASITSLIASAAAIVCTILVGGLLIFSDVGVGDNYIKKSGNTTPCDAKNECNDEKWQDNHIIVSHPYNKDYFCQWCGSMVHGNRCDSCGGPRRKG